MLLYDKKEKTIDVYEFSADANDLYNYRKEQMIQIPKENQIYVATAHLQTDNQQPLFERYYNSFDSVTIPMWHANSPRHNHFLKTTEYTIEHEEILEKLFKGEFIDKKIARIMDVSKTRYFLLLQDEYIKDPFFSHKYFMHNIIEIPESIYLLHLLEQEKFSFIEQKDISEQLALYSLKYVDEVDLSGLKKLDELGIVKDCYKKTSDKAQGDSIILKKYRTRK